MRMTCGLIAVVMMWAQTAAARDIYVSNTSGDDRGTGAAAQPLVPRGGPVRTIAKALRLSQAGDRIILENTGEPYREAISLIGSRRSGGPFGPLVIEGRGAMLDGSVPIPAGGWQLESGNVFSYQPQAMGSQQLFLAGRVPRRRPVTAADPAIPALAPLEWCYWRGKIYFCTEATRLPADYQPSCCGLRTGITLYYVRDVLIRDLAVQGFYLDGVAVHDVVQDTRLERVASHMNGKSGVSVRGASWVELDRCSLSGNGQSQLRVDNFARVWLYDSQAHGDESAGSVGIAQAGGEIFTSPEPFSRAAR